MTECWDSGLGQWSVVGGVRGRIFTEYNIKGRWRKLNFQRGIGGGEGAGTFFDSGAPGGWMHLEMVPLLYRVVTTEGHGWPQHQPQNPNLHKPGLETYLPMGIMLGL